MKKLIVIIGLLAVSGIAFAQLKSSVIKNTAGTEVFSIGYGSGVGTAKVAVVEATTLVGAVSSAQSAVTVSGATGIVSTAAALVAPTNAAFAGFRIRVNGTNYVIALYPN
jgi:hypothetical protein